MAELRIENVRQQYTSARTGQKVVALEDVSLTVADGEFVSIVGPSGCGKTTLLRIVACLLKPSHGRIFLDGERVTTPGPQLGVVFQAPLLYPWRTVLANIAYGLELAHKPKDYCTDRAKEFAELVGLGGFENSYPYELSGGMQQRVSLARALALDPSGLLLDEPFSALDAQTREYMQEELQRIWWQTHKTALLVTHQISEAVYLSDRIVVLSARPGHIREIVPVDIPRPRQPIDKRSPEFHLIEDKIWSMVSDNSQTIVSE